MYEWVKKAYGPSVIQIAPLTSTYGEIIKDRGKHMENSAEYDQEVYFRENVVCNKAIECTTRLPTMDELYSLHTMDELRKVIDSLSYGKKLYVVTEFIRD